MSLAADLAPHLSHLRRYARALTGSQVHGDAYVRACLETIVEAPDEFPRDVGAKVGLYKVFYAIWMTAHVDEPADLDDSMAKPERRLQRRLEELTPVSRQALLLTAMEGFGENETAEIIGITPDEVGELVEMALADIQRQERTKVLIIEDEPAISMDLASLVTDLGHQVVAISMTRNQAVKAARDHKPGLVLADIQLADGSSGLDAVKEILGQMEVPVIFITAFPERLLTGERPEPTFLITKPFDHRTVQATISQALFFNTSEALVA
ncbi:response regulator [Emcibacter sp. SYSU 3D8]|uniref:response regulator n=1 Tax=Emcibacter sp. SYSU 3D8 TaxID=3133969 RepID=UPI0031FF0240